MPCCICSYRKCLLLLYYMYKGMSVYSFCSAARSDRWDSHKIGRHCQCSDTNWNTPMYEDTGPSADPAHPTTYADKIFTLWSVSLSLYCILCTYLHIWPGELVSSVIITITLFSLNHHNFQVVTITLEVQKYKKAKYNDMKWFTIINPLCLSSHGIRRILKSAD